MFTALLTKTVPHYTHQAKQQANNQAVSLAFKTLHSI